MIKYVRTASTVFLTAEQRRRLEPHVRSRSMPAELGARFRIILLAADGLDNKEISEK
jgi:hypothetical protein